MNPAYTIESKSQIITPALIIFHEILEENARLMIEIAGDPSRLRPHCKTHKMREVVQLLLERGISKHKCATFAEAEMLASAGVPDIFLAYNLVGPNIARAVTFRQHFPHVMLSVTADHALPIEQLGCEMTAAGLEINVVLDIDTGQRRTGLSVSEHAEQLYGMIIETSGLRAGGFHVYDGQNHQTALDERQKAVDAGWQKVLSLRDNVLARGWPIPRIVAGGTGSFPIYAAKDETTLELSPGTCIFHDAGYAEMFPDLPFTPAALLLTRVVSRPGNRRVTFDLGYKACASDPPAGRRLVFPEIADAREVLQNEEHLVIETSMADDFEPGDTTIAIPRHVCPTSALHKEAHVVIDRQVREQWQVAARDRRLTI